MAYPPILPVRRLMPQLNSFKKRTGAVFPERKFMVFLMERILAQALLYALPGAWAAGSMHARQSSCEAIFRAAKANIGLYSTRMSGASGRHSPIAAVGVFTAQVPRSCRRFSGASTKQFRQEQKDGFFE